MNSEQTAQAGVAAEATPSLNGWSAESFLERELPPKEPLIEGLLYRRDLIALAGRRRHGKTNFILNLATALTLGEPDFLGYPVPEARRVLAFFLEDDSREIQDKLRRILNGATTGGRFALLTRDEFYNQRVPLDSDNSKFRAAVLEACKVNKPDLVIIDNLAQMIGADYNNPKRIHTLAGFGYDIASKSDASVLVAAHPRKRPNDGQAFNATLRDDPEGFFENVMGSSHFVNSFGSLWGIERDQETDRTVFLGGAQRVTGQQSIATLEMGEDGRLHLVSDYDENLRHALNTTQRRAAWQLIPDTSFTYLEAVAAVKPAMRSESTFHAWWTNFLMRLKLIVSLGENRYVKAQPTGQRGH